MATQVALQCSASGSQPLPLNLARQIAGSGNEIHRQTLVQWLVTRVQQNPSAGDADLKLLFRLQQVDRLRVGQKNRRDSRQFNRFHLLRGVCIVS